MCVFGVTERRVLWGYKLRWRVKVGVLAGPALPAASRPPPGSRQPQGCPARMARRPPRCTCRPRNAKVAGRRPELAESGTLSQWVSEGLLPAPRRQPSGRELRGHIPEIFSHAARSAPYRRRVPCPPPSQGVISTRFPDSPVVRPLCLLHVWEGLAKPASPLPAWMVSPVPSIQHTLAVWWAEECPQGRPRLGPGTATA